MRTEHVRWIGRPGGLRTVAGVLALVLLPTVAGAQGTAPVAARSPDEAIDVALNALEEPIVQPMLVPPGAQQGIPPFPPYKQEPPAAQRDFRVLSSPAGVPPPNPVAAGGAGVPPPNPVVGGGAGGTGPGATSPTAIGPPATGTPPIVGPIPPPFPVPFPGGGGGPVLPLRPPSRSRAP